MEGNSLNVDCAILIQDVLFDGNTVSVGDTVGKEDLILFLCRSDCSSFESYS